MQDFAPFIPDPGVIQALQCVDYKDVFRFYFLNAFLLEKQNS
jgi:hypothetical protein